MTLGDGQLGLDELSRIADLLMGAAHADGTLEGSETEAVRDIMSELLGKDDLPPALLERIGAFDPGSFDVAQTCKAIELSGSKDRRSLLALLAKVSDADDVHDLDEGAYIRKVAENIGAEPDECKGLAVEIVSVTRLDEPPPTPGG